MLISASMLVKGGLLGIDIFVPGNFLLHGLLLGFWLGVAKSLMPHSVANSLTTCPALPPVMPWSCPILLQLTGVFLGQFCNDVVNCSLSHSTLLKFGECFFRFGSGCCSGEQNDCANLFLWYFRFDSPSANIVMDAFFAKQRLTSLVMPLIISLFSFCFSVLVFRCCSPIDLFLTKAWVKDVVSSFVYVSFRSDTILVVNSLLLQGFKINCDYWFRLIARL